MSTETAEALPSRGPLTAEELDEIDLRRRREALAELVPFTKLYPPRVIRTLYGNLLKHVIRQLPDDEQKPASDDLFILNRYVEMFPDDTFDPDTAVDLTDFCTVESMQEAVGRVLTIMADDHDLDLWS